MSVFLVTGASRGLGYGFIQHLAKDSNNTVIGLVRNKSQTDAKLSADNLNQPNVHIVQADLNSYESLVAARTEIEKFTNKIDVLINNAAAIVLNTAFKKLTDFQDDHDTLLADLKATLDTNVLGLINTVNAFLPLVLKGDVKKVINLSTGLADDSLTNEYDVYEAAPYSISKAAANSVIAKYNAAHGKNSDGVLFMSISPGMVNTGNEGAPPPDSPLPQKFMRAYPNWTGPISIEDSINHMFKVIDGASVNDEKYAGGFVSHFGDKNWL